MIRLKTREYRQPKKADMLKALALLRSGEDMYVMVDGVPNRFVVVDRADNKELRDEAIRQFVLTIAQSESEEKEQDIGTGKDAVHEGAEAPDREGEV